MGKDTILVTGATGTVGSEVVAQLRDRGYPVRVLIRDPGAARRFADPVEVAVADLARPETLAAAFDGVTKVFVASNGPQLATLEGNAFAAAAAAGVEHIVKLSGRHVGADFMAASPLAGWHAESEQKLQSGEPAWTILRPGAFASNFLMWLDRARSTITLPIGDGKDCYIDPRDIGAVAATLLTTPGHDGAIYEITGSERLSGPDAARAITAATGRPTTYIDIPENLMRAAMLNDGVPAASADSMLRYFSGIKAGKSYAPTRTVEHILGRPPRTFDDWSHNNAPALT